ncbi:MAG: NnrS family protein, partial [Myxococcota bacterium]
VAVAALDLAFPLALWGAVGVPILRARATRQLGILAVLAGLIVANAASHLDAIGALPGAGRAALHGASVFVALLILVIGGRITPSFTRNAMQRAGAPGVVRMRPWLDRLALGAAAGLAVVEVLALRGVASGLLAGLAAFGTAGRMVGWQTRFALRDPLLASLHAGLAWVAIGFAAIAAADLGAPVPRTVALHALTAGAMGTMILAVMTRVALGHTGRPLVAPPAATRAYVLVGAGALVRVVGPVLEPTAALATWTLSGLLWAGGFASFLVGYAGMLTRPRVDGEPG